MNTNYKAIESQARRVLIIVSLIIIPCGLHAQRSLYPQCDTLTADDGQGHISVTIKPQALAPNRLTRHLGGIVKRKTFTTLQSVLEEQSLQASRIISETGNLTSRDLSLYSVGSIPFEEAISPTGGRLYTVPIATAAGWNATPNVSLVYNSQNGNDVAGFGWGIGGMSAISVRNTNRYYDGYIKGGLYDNPNASYALDGLPIVQSELGLTGYDFATAKGNVQIQKHLSGSGQTLYFTAMYPDGTRATYGFPSNTQSRNSYPITSLTDIDGNTVTFSYSLYNNCYYITNIQYGTNASITFTYTTRNDSSPYKFARFGNYVSYPKKLLTTITSKDGSNTICQYALTHEMMDGVFLLKELHCTSGSSELPPLLFTYGADSESSNTDPELDLVESNLFTLYYTQSDSLDLYYKRGHLLPGNTNDAVVIYPNYSNYDLLDRQWSWQALQYCNLYGSMYDSSQQILINFTGSYGSTLQKVITAGVGFQSIDPVDVDGDGVDELVKVNNYSTQAGVTNYYITIYSFNSAGNYTTETFVVYVNDGISNALFNSPSKSYYRYGNFRGDGKQMLLIMTRDASRFAVVDLNTHQKTGEGTVFSMDDDEDNLVLVADFQNEGKDKLCHITNTGMVVCSFSSSSTNPFSSGTTFSGVTKTQLYTDPFCPVNGIPEEVKARLFMADVNGDGYQDIIAAPGLTFGYNGNDYISSTLNIARFNGKDFQTETLSLYPRHRDDSVVFLDIDKDGLTDILHVHDTLLYYYPNINGIYSLSNPDSLLTIASNTDLVSGDLSMFGSSGDVMIVSGPNVDLYELSINHTVRRNLKRLTDSFGIVHINSYETIRNNNGVYLIDNSRIYSAEDGFMRVRAPLYVLYSGISMMDNQIVGSAFYAYWDAVYHAGGLGFCGYGKTLSVDYVNGVYTTQTLNPEKFGVTEQISVSKSSGGTPFSTVVNTYDDNSTTYGKLNPRLIKSVATNALTGIETTTDYTYGTYDFPATVLTSRRIGTGTAQTDKVIRQYQHNVADTLFFLGAVTEESLITDRDGASLYAWKERLVYTYNNRFKPLTLKKYVGKYGGGSGHLEPILDTLILRRPPELDFEFYDATNLVSETRWQYDSHGNVISKRTAPYGATVFTGESMTYDTNGRYPLSLTDALGRTTTYSGYNKFGKPSTVRDCHNNTTTYTYDDWGNAIAVAGPDGSVEQTALAWGGTGLYTVSNTITGKPDVIVHYDALGRELRSGTKRFDAQWQWTDREYDDKGRLHRVSLPFRGQSASYWNRYSYDLYNRPDTIALASGKLSTWSYSGTSTTTVKDGITSTSTTDASGNVISVTDAGGTITYTLRDDGQPSKVTAPGNVQTRVAYDDFGRKVQLTDPSAGTYTYSYQWNADGSSDFTQTNPNGSVTTCCDRFGRTTLVQRSGDYNTTYTYDSYGRLTSEQSTNGTGREYSYDGLDRLTTVLYSVPDGKYLRKVFSRTTGSVLTGVMYVCQTGIITTENYTYANGYNTGITLSNGTVVWSLVSENDLGMATEITTGTINREYGFNAFGMPTFRRMDDGDLQDYSYQFDVATGNLLVRQDLVHNVTETFGYDNLNRLTSIGSRQITYAANGNILSMDGVGTMTYGSTQYPYQITSFTPSGGNPIPQPSESIVYNGQDRPVSISEGGWGATITYDGDGDRAKMYVSDGSGHVLTRYYMGGRYEFEQSPSSTKERLYLGGDAYSAPMVLCRQNGGIWTAYNVGRDYLGNITHIATTGGTLVAEYSYDPWGRLRNPETLSIYSPGNEPTLFLGRGFTGHEHLTWFGLINMNARLYDPMLGRFLSPDPYVQAPNFTQNLNRYVYALDNPLKYTDLSGAFLTWGIYSSGFSVGLNFTPIGIPLGFGINVGWGNGLSLGGYGEIGFRMGCFGVTTCASYDYNFKYETGGWTFSAGAYASLGIISANASICYSTLGGWNWNVGLGCGWSGSNAGIGAYVSCGSSGWNYGIGGWCSKKINVCSFRMGDTEPELSETIPLDATDDVLKYYQELWYPDAPMESIKNFSVESVPEWAQKYLDNEQVYALTKPSYKLPSKKLTGKSSVYFSNKAFSSEKQLYTTMGHEFVHVSNYITAASLGFTIDNVNNKAFDELTEFWAYSYQASITGSTMNSFDMELIHNSFPDELINAFSYFNMDWYKTRCIIK